MTQKAACWAARTGCLSGTSQSNLSSCLRQPIYNSTEMTHGYTKSIPPNTQKGTFHTHHKAPNTIAPSTPASSEDDLQGLQGPQWIRAGSDEIHYELPLHHDLSKNPSASRWYKDQKDGGQVSLNTCGLWYPLLLFSPKEVGHSHSKMTCRFQDFFEWLPMLKTPGMESIKPPPFSMRYFQLFTRPCFRKYHMSCM